MTNDGTRTDGPPTETPAGSATGPAQPMMLVQALKGAPASVLLALALAGRSLSHAELQLWTRCGKNQVTLALKSLVQLGWATGRTPRGPWTLSRAPHMPFGSDALGAFPFKGLSSSSDSLNTTVKESLLPSPRRRELIEAAEKAGIREPTASELADLPHMTVEYLRGHVEATRANGLRVGAAIEAMRLGAPVPERPSSRNRQAEVEEKIRRFKEGG